MEGLLADRYQLETVVGSGGMGTVWRATDLLLDRQVAIKEVRFSAQLTDDERREQSARAVTEARHAARLEHPRIVPIYDVLLHDGRPWIVMRLVPGPSLEQQVRAHGRLTPAEVRRLARGLLEALAAAHRGGVLHRDVKPSNVLIGEDGEPLLTDFSIARTIGQGSATTTGFVVGSPGYIAPERVISGTSGPEADLFGLGATLYFAAEGVAPFAHEDAVAGTFASAIHPHPRPVHAGPELIPLLDGLLEKDPRSRLTIAGAAGLLGMPAPASPPPPGGAPAPAAAQPSVSPPVTPRVSAAGSPSVTPRESAPVTPRLAQPAVEPGEALKAGVFALGRAEVPAPELAVFDPPADAGERAARRWDSGRLVLIAALVVVLAGGAAAIAQVADWSLTNGAPPPSSAGPQPATPSSTPAGASPTPTASPSASQGPTQDPIAAANLELFKQHGFGEFAARWAPVVHQCQTDGPDRIVCALKSGGGRQLALTRAKSDAAASSQMSCGYVGAVKTGGPANLNTDTVRVRTPAGIRSIYYCEGWEEYPQEDGANLRVSWLDGAFRLVGELILRVDRPFSGLESALTTSRSLWNTYA